MAMMAASLGMSQAPAQMPDSDMANVNQQEQGRTKKKETKKKKTKKKKRTRLHKDNKEKKNKKKAPQTQLERALQDAGAAAKE